MFSFFHLFTVCWDFYKQKTPYNKIPYLFQIFLTKQLRINIWSDVTDVFIEASILHTTQWVLGSDYKFKIMLITRINCATC